MNTQKLLSRRVRIVLGIVILLVTTWLLFLYGRDHPEIWQKLASVEMSTVILLFALYAVFFSCLILVTHFSLVFYGKTLRVRENFLLTAYSSLTNFFGPGQNGPGVRAIYLKARLKLEIKKYILVVLVYYAFYALISCFMLLVGFQLWLSVCATIILSLVLIIFIKRYSTDNRLSTTRSRNYIGIVGIFVATMLQAITQVAIYHIELVSIGVKAELVQVISFTGAANFALFVNLTPGAIGIRESFLLFSESLHHTSSQAIVSVGVLDRAVYVAFLGLLFLLVVILHGQGRFKEFRSK